MYTYNSNFTLSRTVFRFPSKFELRLVLTYLEFLTCICDRFKLFKYLQYDHKKNVM